ncbi:MAG: hypothetical protein JSW33_07810 [bacterium]|nr:MAG: hypothetical protein JSW33_07810 [bacterium]
MFEQIKSISSWVFLFIIILFLHCDKGLSPENVEPPFTGIRGTVYFINWPAPNNPPPDTVFDVRLILFPDFPPADFADEILSGRAVLYPTLNDEKLPIPLDSLDYQIPLQPGRYEYFAVARQYGDNLFADWHVVGHYDTTFSDTLPTPIQINQGQLLDSINILANFDSVLFEL